MTLTIVDTINSERNDECIDFTMMCFFFCVSVYSITSLASISNFGDGFRRQNEYPWCIIGVKSKHFPTVFKKIEKNKKKVTENGNFYAKPVFDQTVFLYGCNSKTNHCKYIKLPPHMLLISRRYLKISP
ncbi:Uncharacterized protein FWK35_00019140, partial [Aphis craccivora]